MYNLVVRSKNKSCAPLRKLKFDKKVLYRMGSTTPLEEIYKKINEKPFDIQINNVVGCGRSGDKLSMKYIFNIYGIKTADYTIVYYDELAKGLVFEKLSGWLKKWNNKMIIKHMHSSKGKGIYFITNEDELKKFIEDKGDKIVEYVFEKYYTYTKEYRLHVSKGGCFYACRKMLKNDAQERWHRHENNSVWILEENPLFDKPKCWDAIVEECIKALKALYLDVAAFDVKVQGNDKENPDFIILESNTAPALGEIGIEKYKEFLTKYITNLSKFIDEK